MARNPSSTTHRGWAWDDADAHLEIIVNGTQVGSFRDSGSDLVLDTNGLTSAGITISGRGTVTQDTNKSTGVTLNSRAGTITMNNAGLTAGSEIGFTVTNSVVGVNDVIILSLGATNTTANAYTAEVSEVAAGAFNITISNTTGGTLSEAIELNFAVIKVAA